MAYTVLELGSLHLIATFYRLFSFKNISHALQANLFFLFQYLFPGLEVKHHAGEDVFLSLVSASGKLQLLHKVPSPTITSYLGSAC